MEKNNSRNIYEIYVRSFFDSNDDGIGDLRGITLKLDYLKNLGINTIWLTPIFESPNYDLGYDISDYYKINPEYGTMDDLIELIEEAHKRSISVLLDLVLNHCSFQHPWFVDALTNENSKYKDFFIFRNQIENNLGCQFETSAWHKVKDGQYYLGLFSKYQPDFNWRNNEVRTSLLSIVEYYLKLGVDGFRFDVLSLIQKPETFSTIETNKEYADFKSYSNYPGIDKYLQELSELLKKYHAISIGEGSGLTPAQGLEYGQYIDYMLTFGLMNLDQSETDKFTTTSFHLQGIVPLLKNDQALYSGKVPYVLFCENHDQPRIVSRITTSPFYDAAARGFATFFYALEGTALLYQGQEIGMTNYRFKENELIDVESINAYKNSQDKTSMLNIINKKSRDHARTIMQWTDGRYGGFSKHKPWTIVNSNKDVINVAMQEKNPYSLLRYYQRLLSLKNQIVGTVSFLDTVFPEIAYKRGQYLILSNFSEKEIKCTVDISKYNIALNSETTFYGKLAPWQSVIFVKTEL